MPQTKAQRSATAATGRRPRASRSWRARPAGATRRPCARDKPAELRLGLRFATWTRILATVAEELVEIASRPHEMTSVRSRHSNYE
jgi:hypothetical protein